MTIITDKNYIDAEIGFECDCCNKIYYNKTSDFEYYEKFSLNQDCGYASIFGDGNIIECDLCQMCLKKLLGNFIRISTKI